MSTKTVTLSAPATRTLKALAKVKGALSRKKIAEAAFNGNSVNLKPILAVLAAAKYITPKEVDVDGATEEVFLATAAGRKAAKAAPANPVRGNGEHKSLPKVGGTIEKEYLGKKVTVTVVADGFRYKGKVYPSLTATAKAVRESDMEVNGWAFFGLTK